MNVHLFKKLFCKETKPTKSIYKLAYEQIKSIKYDILNYGYPDSRYLRQPSDLEFKAVNHLQSRELINSLKITAAYHNSFSLSAPQIKKEHRVFCYYKDLSLSKWLNKDLEIKLDPANYQICINPKIISVSDITNEEYEECGSFPLIKVNAKRPLAIDVSYLDEEGKLNEKELTGFEARVFCHEYDHLSGIPFIHWRVCEGNIIIKDECITAEDKYENLFYALDYYKNRIREAKLYHPEIFENETPNMNLFDRSIHLEDVPSVYKKLSFEDIMLIDIEKAIRKDLKLKLKRTTAENVQKIVSTE